MVMLMMMEVSKKGIWLFVAIGLWTSVGCRHQAAVGQHEIVPGAVWKDTDGNAINAHGGGVLYHEGTYYWYGEYKGDSTYRLPEVTTWECWRADAGGVSCYTSQDLVNWTFEGLVLPSTPDDAASDLHPSQVIERPKVIHNERTGKFVMWLHIESPDYEKAHAGVAVSDSPTGPFTYLGSFRPNGADSRDQTVFKDDDGRAYHLYSSEWNKTLYIGLLDADYTQHTGTYTRNFVDRSREAPAVFKRAGKYYMLTSGCTGWDPNTAELAVADSMLGEWRVIGNPCVGKDADSTFFAQGTFVFPVHGKEDRYIAMFDRWNKTDLIDSRYVWLPVDFSGGEPVIAWADRWTVDVAGASGDQAAASPSRAHYLDAEHRGEGRDGSRASPWNAFGEVDAAAIQPGDTLYIVSDMDVAAPLLIDGWAGTARQPIVISGYGPAPPTLRSGDREGIRVSDSRHISIYGLSLVGSGRKEGNVTDGLHITGSDHIAVDGVQVSGYQKAGLRVYGCTAVTLSHVHAHGNGFSGMLVDGPTDRKTGSRNIRIRHCRAENNPGDPTNFTNHSGNGILVAYSTDVIVEYCTATNNGWDMPRTGNGPVGIWAYESDSVLIQHCLAYRNKTPDGAEDGGGFDLDGGVTNSIIQYCLSYENDGSGFGLFQYDGASPWHNNVLRFNISENDGQKSTAKGGIYVWNATDDPNQLRDCAIYNNTVYNRQGVAIRYAVDSRHRDFGFYNNLFVAGDELLSGRWQGSRFLGNAWFSQSATGFKVQPFTDLRAWADANGMERWKGQAVGANVDPRLPSPGRTDITDTGGFAAYNAYKPASGDDVHRAGLDLAAAFGIAVGHVDFNGLPVKPGMVGACR